MARTFTRSNIADWLDFDLNDDQVAELWRKACELDKGLSPDQIDKDELVFAIENGALVGADFPYVDEAFDLVNVYDGRT